MTSSFGGIRGAAWLALIPVLAIIMAVYWPLMHAGFVWDDILDFVNMPWLRYGDAWKHYVLRDYNDWVNYFRPLVVAMFTAQVRLFDSQPGPMHAVSLGMHLLDTCLLGVLTHRLAVLKGQHSATRSWRLAALTMLVYGLHPALIEPVSWISCQFELAIVFFGLVALLANVTIATRWARALAVGACFFLAACSKETAAVIPVVVVVYDWLAWQGSASFVDRVVAQVRRNILTYAACIVAGIGYLWFRHWALGALVDARTIASPGVTEHLQEVAFVYLTYLKQIVWPMSGQGPIHPYDTLLFAAVGVASVLRTIGAGLIVVISLYGLLVRRSALAAMITVATVALLPVLHVISIGFDSSLYHERYLMAALAFAFPLGGLVHWNSLFARHRLVVPALAVLLAVWLAVGVMNIRVTIPLWSSNLALWQWAARNYPDSVEAKDMLITAYASEGDAASARALGRHLMDEHIDCPNCLLNVAVMAASEGATDEANRALDLLQQSPTLAVDKRMFKSYLATRGRVALQEGNNADAESLLHAAFDADPLDPESAFSLTVALARMGRTEEARQMASKAVALALPAERAGRAATLAQALASAPRDR